MKQKGFTLIEGLLALALLAIVLGLAIPPLALLLQRQQLDSARQQLVGAIAATRYEAATRKQAVTLLQRNGNWANGWVMFVDTDADSELDAGESVLRDYPALRDSIELTGNQPVSRYIRYTANGHARLYSGAFQTGTLLLCAANADLTGTQLILSIGGRLRQAATTGEQCR